VPEFIPSSARPLLVSLPDPQPPAPSYQRAPPSPANPWAPTPEEQARSLNSPLTSPWNIDFGAPAKQFSDDHFSVSSASWQQPISGQPSPLLDGSLVSRNYPRVALNMQSPVLGDIGLAVVDLLYYLMSHYRASNKCYSASGIRPCVCL
jgi:hypothetical protein